VRIAIPGGFFEEEGHRYFDTQSRRILSVTQVFAELGLVNYDRVQKEVLERKSALGVAVHRAVELLCEGPEVLDWNTVDEAAIPYVVAAEEWMRKTGFVSEEREQRGIMTVNGMQCGFQFDHKGRIQHRGKERRVILDIKNCVDVSPTWRLQTAAYALSQAKLPAGEKYLRIVLQLDGEGKCRPHFYEDREDENAFLYMLYCAIWKKNHMKEEAA
jgi:hypothetical protein